MTMTPGLARSWLLVNATRPHSFDSARRAHADEIILDLEDAVDPSLKSSARQNVTDWLLTDFAWVRINPVSTEFWAEDIDALAGAPGLRGVLLAKTESAEEVTDTFDRLGGSTPVMALIESALGIEEATAIARARGVIRLAFGSGDYRRDTGTSADSLAMSYPRSRLVVASRVGNLPGPIDGPTVGSSHSVLRENSAVAVALGLTGKLCLEIEQLPVINESFSPTISDIAWASAFIDEFSARGRVVRDGSDPPRLGMAEKIMRLADAYGLR
jgi:citrate lyase subunit beta/citryl-CoA lyase